MIITGLQKLTLLDFPEKMACTVFTSGCNFRCPFCHNASLVTDISNDGVVAEEEFFKFLKTRQGILDGVCITGGEPTLQHGLDEFLRKIKELGFSVKLDTNGYRPAVLKNLVSNNLVDYVAMDIKNSKEKYGITAGLENIDIDAIDESVEFLIGANVDFEFRTTVVKELHTPQDIENICKWIKGAKKYFLQGFKDSGDLICPGFSGYDQKEMESLLKITKNYFEVAELRGF